MIVRMNRPIRSFFSLIHVALMTVLSTLFLSCADEEMASINIQKETSVGWGEKESCTIVYTYKDEYAVLPGEIKCRGGMSSKYFKHSYSLELSDKYALGNLNTDDDWVLNANYIDKTFMRHKISYDLFRQMGPKNIAAHCSYVTMKLNGKNEGLYVLMQEINTSMIGIDKSDTLGMLFKDPPIFYEETLSYVQDSLNYYQQKYPKKSEFDQTDYIERFRDFLFHSTDAEFASEIGDWIDLDNVIDWHILLLFSNNCDGIMKNFLLYKLNSESPFRIAIWDYDHSFGRDGDNTLNMMEVEVDCSRSILLDRLMRIPKTAYLGRLKERWIELRSLTIISTASIENMIKENDDLINKSIAENFERWPANSKWYKDDNTYIEELDLIRDFVDLRINQLDKHFEY